jgi:crotonobetainyl-CoA:carnitine CoA-transferase CaiB-like acyl-CoA transferase
VGLVLRLVETADAVVENYAPDVMPKLGLDYAALSSRKPELIMLSLPAFTADSAWSDVRAYGSTLEHASGLPSVTGHDGGVPTMNHLAYGDANGGLNGAAALLAALLERRVTGRGRHIEVSQVEAMLPLTAYWMIHESLHDQPLAREGTRHPVHAPHGCFRCAGDDAWVAVAVLEDVQWHALAAVIGRRDLTEDARLATASQRKAREAELEAAIESWCAPLTAADAAAQLQAVGVPAGEVLAPADLPTDRHLIARDFWQLVHRAHVPPQLQASLPFRTGSRPYRVRSPAPTLGEHGEATLMGLLDLDPETLSGLRERSVIGTKATGGKVRARLQQAAGLQRAPSPNE